MNYGMIINTNNFRTDSNNQIFVKQKIFTQVSLPQKLSNKYIYNFSGKRNTRFLSMKETQSVVKK